MLDFFKDLFRQWIEFAARAYNQSFQLLYKLIGHGVKAAIIHTMLIGVAFFASVRAILSYTPFAFSVADATVKWQRFLGANTDFWAWFFFDVLAFDVGVELLLSALGFYFAAMAVYWLLSCVLFFAKRI